MAAYTSAISTAACRIEARRLAWRQQARQHRIALDNVTSHEVREREKHISTMSGGQLTNHFERFVGSSLQNEDVRDVLSI